MLTASELTFTEFEGRAFDGIIGGNLRLRWGTSWSLDGEINVRQMDVSKIAGPLLSAGRLEGKAVYSMRADAPDKLFAAIRSEGSYVVQKGSFANIDMAQALQGNSVSGGNTPFGEASGTFVADASRVQIRQFRMSAGLLSGTGTAEADAKGNVSGRIQVELRGQARTALNLTGTLAQSQFRR